MKLYAIVWGYRSSLDYTNDIQSIWTSKVLAQVALDKIVKAWKLIQVDNEFTDGDYYNYITTIFADSESMYHDSEET